MELDLTGIHKLAAEQGIDPETLDDALAEALRLAYLKTPHAAKHARVELDERSGNFTVWAADEIPVEPTEDNPYPVPKLGEEYDDTPRDFGRLAAATARQVITQLFRRAEDEKVFGAFSGQKGKLITGIIQQDASDPSNVHVAMGDVEAILPRREQVPGERYRHGERIRVYVVNVARGIKGPEIVVSRSHPELVRKLFEREVPELVSGAVSIMAIAREAGARTKIAVKANTDGVNPKGALIGPGGARVRAVMENLGPEDRHRRLLRRSGQVRGSRAVPGCGHRRAGDQREEQDRHRLHPRRPAVLGHRQGRPERTTGSQADRLEDRHRIRRGPCQEGRRRKGRPGCGRGCCSGSRIGRRARRRMIFRAHYFLIRAASAMARLAASTLSSAMSMLDWRMWAGAVCAKSPTPETR